MRLASICGLALTVLAPFNFLARHAVAEAAPRTIEIVADKDDRFRLPGQDKQVLILKANEPLLLKITARAGEETARDGAVHSLVIRSLRTQGWDIRLKPGEQDVHIRAPSRPGTYQIECTVKCGSGHDNMKLKVVVEP